MIEKHFEPDRLSPSHLSIESLISSSLSQISKYDLLAGHFDYAVTLALPRPNIKRIAIFRDPIERLISFYRFHRAHPYSERQLDFVALAQDLTPSEFFRHERVLSSTRLNNTYMRTFGTCLRLPIVADAADNETSAALELAAIKIRGLDAIGLTERMQDSVTLIWRVLGFAPPEKIRATHRTDEFVTRPGFTRPAPVERTADLEAAVAPLVSMDLHLYEIAKETFSTQLAINGQNG